MYFFFLLQVCRKRKTNKKPKILTLQVVSIKDNNKAIILVYNFEFWLVSFAEMINAEKSSVPKCCCYSQLFLLVILFVYSVRGLNFEFLRFSFLLKIVQTFLLLPFCCVYYQNHRLLCIFFLLPEFNQLR